MAATLRAAVRAIDPELPVSDIQLMQARVAESLVVRRTPALVITAFSTLAVLLTAIGTYGVLSFAVSRRRREIGLRMALGARPAQVRAQFLSTALRLLAAGTAIGIPAAWLAGRIAQTMLFRVSAIHVPTLVAATVLLTGLCFCACLIPSHRAACISPTEALAGD